MYQITPMNSHDIPQALTIWHNQFESYCYNDSFPRFFPGGEETVAQYLAEQIEKGNAIVARHDTAVVGYMAWMTFDFHGERTAFLPIVGNAAVAEDENAIFHALYAAASQIWVCDNRFNHLWMTFFDDISLQNMLYDIGFGSYVIDACQKTSPKSPPSPSAYQITPVTLAHADALLSLANDSEENLSRPPIFLIRKPWAKDKIISLIATMPLYVAWDNDLMVGLLSFDVNQDYDLEYLTSPTSARISGIGAYVRPEYRNKGIGKQLVQQACDHCYRAGKSFFHVSFESANPDAIRFWPKHFRPAIRSVRRTINKDANTVL